MFETNVEDGLKWCKPENVEYRITSLCESLRMKDKCRGEQIVWKSNLNLEWDSIWMSNPWRVVFGFIGYRWCSIWDPRIKSSKIWIAVFGFVGYGGCSIWDMSLESSRPREW